MVVEVPINAACYKDIEEDIKKEEEERSAECT